MKTKTALLIVAVELAVMFAGSTLLTPLYDVYRREFGFSQLTLTLIYATYVIGNFCALSFLGRLSDQIGRRKTTLPAMAVASVSTLIFLCATSPRWLFAGRGLSGLAIGLASGTATAWIAELTPGGDKSRASVVAASANFVGISFGPILAGPLAQYAPAPLRLTHGVFLVILAITALLVARVRETVRDPVRRWNEVSLRPRIGVPREIRARFLPPAITAFTAFALVGFYAALAPSLLIRELHQTNLAIDGAIVSTMFLAGVVGIWATRRAPSRLAMLASLAGLFFSVALLIVTEISRSLPVLMIGTVISGFAAAVAYRGSLQVVNQLAPPGRRAEVISSYLVVGFLGNALPVVGIGVLSQFTSPTVADVSFAVAIALLTVVALVTGVKLAPQASLPRLHEAPR